MTSVIFFGTPDFVLPIPQALLKAGYYLTTVVTSPDQPAGRHKILTPSPVKAWAQKHEIPFLTPEKLDENFLHNSILCNSQLFILAAYGQIIPLPILKLPRYGCLNIHPSLLPKYRGPSPVQAAILAGERQTGVTIIKMDEKVDHGPIVAQFKETIRPKDTAETLIQRLFSSAAEALTTILPAYIEGRVKPREQNHQKATYSKILKREDGYVDLENPPSPEVLDRMICAYYPWPGVWSRLRQGFGGQAHLIKFLPQQKVQVEGGKPMTYKDFLNGYPEAKDWLSKILQI